MKLKPNYFIIPLITITVAVFGSLFTGAGMYWYDSQVIKPDITPFSWVFPVAWNTIFILTTISVFIVWNRGNRKIREFGTIIFLFSLNAFLNVFWSFLFFYLQQIGLALMEMLFLLLTLVWLVMLVRRSSIFASILLWPYLLWVAFATYLMLLIFKLN